MKGNLHFSLLIACSLYSISESAQFTRVPPSVLYVLSGGNATFEWDYSVTDRENTFSTSSPRWSFYTTSNDEQIIAVEDYFDPEKWKWKINSATCPARLLNPTRVRKEAKATLVISNVTNADSGVYGCTLVLQDVSKSITNKVELIVPVPPTFSPHYPKRKYNFIEGKRMKIICTAKGSPTPNITWVRIIDGRDAAIIISKLESAVLNISNVNRSSAGIYECQASNNPLTSVNTIQTTVTIYYKPTIITKLSSKNVISWNGRQVTLACLADGLPRPNITWHSPNSQQITESVTAISNGSQVTITTGEQSGDYGWYECQAKNMAGMAKLSISVTQLFPPGPPNVTILVEDIQASSVIVRWTIPSYNGGSPVIGYIVQINSTKQPNEQNTSKFEQEFTDLTKNTRYEVKVYASNIVGHGNASITIFTTKKKGPPPLPELHLKKSETLITLNWTKPDENGGEIKNYTIYQKIAEETTKWTPMHVVTDLTNLMFELRLLDLKPGQTYRFIVTASNEFGESKIGEEDKGKEVYISPEVTTTTPTPTTGFVPGKDERKSTSDKTNPVVIAGAVGAVVLFVIAAVIAVIILRKKNVFGRGIAKKSRRERAAYHNEIDPDSVNQQGVAGALGGADDGMPTYAAVDVSKKKKKERESGIPNYAAVDKSKKKRPGEIVYAELADFNTSGAAAAATPHPITYTGTDYADISQFQNQDEPEPTYANFPGRKNNFSNVQGM